MSVITRSGSRHHFPNRTPRTHRLHCTPGAYRAERRAPVQTCEQYLPHRRHRSPLCYHRVYQERKLGFGRVQRSDDIPADTLKLVKRQGMSRYGNGEFVWTRRGTSEARVGKSEAAGACDQSLFLRGFKLDFSQKARSRMRATKPRTLSHGCKNAGATINHTQKNTPAFFGCARVAGGHANLTLENHTLGRFPTVEEYTSDSDNDDAYITSPTKEPRSGYEVSQRTTLETISLLTRGTQSPHPCDHINHYLLENVSDSQCYIWSIHLKHP
jgi:hypothetical protein